MNGAALAHILYGFSCQNVVSGQCQTISFTTNSGGVVNWVLTHKHTYAVTTTNQTQNASASATLDWYEIASSSGATSDFSTSTAWPNGANLCFGFEGTMVNIPIQSVITFCAIGREPSLGQVPGVPVAQTAGTTTTLTWNWQYYNDQSTDNIAATVQQTY